MNATKSFDKFLKKAGLTEEEREEYKNALSQRTKEKIEDMLKTKEETGAIEFLKHARKVCRGKGKCKNCICHRYDKYNECQIIRNLRVLSNKDITDLVREVERWWRENEKRNNHN